MTATEDAILEQDGMLLPTRVGSARAGAASRRSDATGAAWRVPDLPGILSAGEVLLSAASIASLQRPDGMIPWFEGGHCDPWNHVEAAMALTVAGFLDEAQRAYQWLIDTQLPEGAWFNYYLPGAGVKDPRLDTNVCAYVATGAWHYYLSTGDVRVLEEMWPCIDRALRFVLGCQSKGGSVLWSIDPDGHPGCFALLTGSSSIYHALSCGVACAEALGLERPDWELAASRLAHAIACCPSHFEPKEEFAMDWYYPVLAGVLGGAEARLRIDGGWDTFVMEGLGVRCVSTGPWVTAAETAECVLALDAIGRYGEAIDLLTWVQALRRDDGSYWTGMVYPEQVTFPAGETTTYTTAAIVLAMDALAGATPAAGIFRADEKLVSKRDFPASLGPASVLAQSGILRSTLRDPQLDSSTKAPEDVASRHIS